MPRVKVERAVQYVDHNVVQLDYKNPDDHRMLQALARKYGLHFSRPGNGISHYIHMERFGKPGQTMLGADSHTTQAGCLGMIAIGAGGLDVAVVLGGYPYEIACPEVVEVRLEGSWQRPWVQAKDIILELLRRLSASGGKNKVFEFTGPGTADLIDSRARHDRQHGRRPRRHRGGVPARSADARVARAPGPAGDFVEVGPDQGAEYDDRIEIDLGAAGAAGRQAAQPRQRRARSRRSPARRWPRCASARRSTRATTTSRCPVRCSPIAAARSSTRQIAATATPGSRQILAAIAESGVYRQLSDGGVRMLEPVCGPCVGMGQAPPSDSNSLRTFNRNFPGRSGTPEDSVFLCSPAVAAVSLLSGKIEDPREYGEPPELLPMPELRPYVEDVHIFPPAPADEAERIEIPRGPNIKRPPKHKPMEESLEARVATVQPDDISTGDLAPDGVEVMAYRSNVPAIAEFTLRHRDPEFRKRLKEWGSGFIVAGENYGQGSSREHAALAPLLPRREGGDRQVVRADPPAQPRRAGDRRADVRRRRRLRQGRGGADVGASPSSARSSGRAPKRSPLGSRTATSSSRCATTSRSTSGRS